MSPPQAAPSMKCPPFNQQEVARLKKELDEQQQEAVDAQRTALERQRMTLTGSMEEQEKGKRLEELTRKPAC